MAESSTKLPVKKEDAVTERARALQSWHPMENLRREVDRLFDDFGLGGWISPWRRSAFNADALWRGDRMFAAVPAMDVVETDKNYEITADLPGLEEKDIEVKVANGCLTIRGEKHEEKEEKKKDYYLHERQFGSYERLFRLPEGVDSDRIEATFKKGVLAVTLPKTAEAQKSEKRIQIKAG